LFKLMGRLGKEFRAADDLLSGLGRDRFFSLPELWSSKGSSIENVLSRPAQKRRLFASYRVFHFEVSSMAPGLDLGSKSQQILKAFQSLGAKARAIPVDFSNALDANLVH
jgi:hypothetical protein